MHLAFVFAVRTEMHHLNKNNKKKKKNVIVTAATVVMLATILVVAAANAAATVGVTTIKSADATFDDTRTSKMRAGVPAAPAVVSGDNIYVAWWTNNTENGNEEVMFRASNDGGQTFGDKINLSNTTDADSWRVEIAGEGADVVVSWWETNQTSDTPVARISTDGGQTFGPVLRLASNGTLSSTETTAAAAAEEGEAE
jgi:hypothetical protein